MSAENSSERVDVLFNISISNETIHTIEENYKAPVFTIAGSVGIAISVSGILLNTVIIVAKLNFKENRRSTTDILIINQSFADLLCCVAQITNYSLSVTYYYFRDDEFGLTLIVCRLFSNRATLSRTAFGAVSGALIVITLDRYVKTVHPVFHRKTYRPWMIYPMVMIPWIVGLVISVPVQITTTFTSNGLCLPTSRWSSVIGRYIYATTLLLIEYVIPMIVFFFCNIRIARTFMKVTAVPKAIEEQGGTHSIYREKKQRSVILNLIAICTTCVICRTLDEFTAFVQNSGLGPPLSSEILSAAKISSNISHTINPFLYALRYVAVRQSVKKLILPSSRKEPTKV